MYTLQHKFSFPGQLSQVVFPDLQLTTSHEVPGNFILAHRVVLSAVSSKLFNLCKKGGKVVIRNIEYEVLKDVVEFIYKGSIKMKSNEDIENLRDGLDMLKVNIEIENVGVPVKEYGEATNNNDPQSGCVFRDDDTIPNVGASDGQASSEEKSFAQVLEEMSNLVENVPNKPTNKLCRDIEVPNDDCSVYNGPVDGEVEKAIGEDIPCNPIKVVKSRTKIPCDFCGECVTLATYVSHCKKLHSLRADNDEDCKTKCVKCGHLVHNVAKKFHDQIYHPPQKKGKPGAKKSQSLKIVEHNKKSTRILCDYCDETFVFKVYRAHVRRKHPEVNYKERVKCGKCSHLVFKIAFYYHGLIFHNSDKVEYLPASDLSPKSILTMQIPKVEVEQSEIQPSTNEPVDAKANPGVVENIQSSTDKSVDAKANPDVVGKI